MHAFVCVHARLYECMMQVFHCYCCFPLEYMCQDECSLFLNSVHRAELYFNVRGWRLKNMSPSSLFFITKRFLPLCYETA